jgi:hypothetical protein
MAPDMCSEFRILLPFVGALKVVMEGQADACELLSNTRIRCMQ